MYKLFLFSWWDLLRTTVSVGFICFGPRSAAVCVPPVYSILSFLEDPTLGFKLVLLFERDHPGKGHSAAVCEPTGDPSLVSPSGVQAPHLFDAFELLLGEQQMQGCSLTHVLTLPGPRGCPGQILTLVWNIGSKSCFFNLN